MDKSQRNEPHPVLKPSFVNLVRALTDNDTSRNGSDDSRDFGKLDTGEPTASAKPPELDQDLTVNVSIHDDPAMAIGLSLAFAKVCRGRKTRIPYPVVKLLLSHVEEHDAACALVLAALQARGVVGRPPPVTQLPGSRSFATDQGLSTSKPDMSDSDMNAGGSSDA